VFSSSPAQIFVRYLDSPTPVQITHTSESALPMAWSPDSRRVIFLRGNPAGGIWSVSVAGGEPQPFLRENFGRAVAVSPDLKSVAIVRRSDDHLYSVWTSSPPGAPFQRYIPTRCTPTRSTTPRCCAFRRTGRSCC
jgi:hypothetical protein